MREKRKTFKYKKRSAEDLDRRTNQSNNKFDTVLVKEAKFFKPKDGDNNIRILPPTWDGANHYGFDLHVHYQIGPDKGSFVCVNETFGKHDCVICKERFKASANGDEEYAKSLKPSRRVAVYLIDRDKEEEGPKIWPMPWTVDEDIASRSKSKKTGQIYNVDDPDEGYDISFQKKGKGVTTKYETIDLDRESSDLGENGDDWLDYIVNNPLPSMLDIKDQSYIQNVFTGGFNKDDQEDQESDSDGDNEKESQPDSSLSEMDIRSMDEDELDELVLERKLGIDKDDFESLDDYADEIINSVVNYGAKKKRLRKKLSNLGE